MGIFLSLNKKTGGTADRRDLKPVDWNGSN